MPVVLVLDLHRYTRRVRKLEAELGVEAVADLNDRISRFIVDSLKSNKITEDFQKSTGDGAILVFQSANEAFDFAQSVHSATADHNSRCNTVDDLFHFRMGAATGQIARRGNDIAGGVIIDATRLEAASETTGLAVDEDTYKALLPNRPKRFRTAEEIQAKDEVFKVFRCQFGPTSMEWENKILTRDPMEERSLAGKDMRTVVFGPDGMPIDDSPSTDVWSVERSLVPPPRAKIVGNLGSSQKRSQPRWSKNRLKWSQERRSEALSYLYHLSFEDTIQLSKAVGYPMTEPIDADLTVVTLVTQLVNWAESNLDGGFSELFRKACVEFGRPLQFN